LSLDTGNTVAKIKKNYTRTGTDKNVYQKLFSDIRETKKDAGLFDSDNFTIDSIDENRVKI
jgi:hypothetical protein